MRLSSQGDKTMHAWSCEQCIANPQLHEARGLCGTAPFPTEAFVYELGVEVDVDDDGRSYVEGSAVIEPIPGWLAEEAFYECPLIDMEPVFGPLVRLYASTAGGIGLSAAQLGYEGTLSAAGVEVLHAIAAAIAERDAETPPQRSKPNDNEE